MQHMMLYAGTCQNSSMKVPPEPLRTPRVPEPPTTHTKLHILPVTQIEPAVDNCKARCMDSQTPTTSSAGQAAQGVYVGAATSGSKALSITPYAYMMP